MIRGFVLIGLLTVTAAACSPASEPGAATVTVDVFSGRPNPSWTLDDTQSADLLRRWDELAAASATAYPSVLGYRGVIVEFADGTRLLVGGGSASASGPGEARRDPGRSLERWLLGTGAGTLEPGLLAELLAQITG